MKLEGGPFSNAFDMSNAKLIPNKLLKTILGDGGSIHLTSSFEGESKEEANQYLNTLQQTLNRSLKQHGIPGNIIITLTTRSF